VPVDRCDEVERLYRTGYQGFTARHFHEHLVRDHRFAWSYSWTKAFLQSRNLLPKAAPAQAAASSVARNDAAPGRLAARVAVRRTGAWSGGDDGRCLERDLFGVPDRGRGHGFNVLALLAVFSRHSLPLSLYTDHGSHYFYTAEAGGQVGRGQPTQVGRALAHLG
jgi:hypothetical protein